jgi:hypothetical protein
VRAKPDYATSPSTADGIIPCVFILATSPVSEKNTPQVTLTCGKRRFLEES